MIWRDKSVGQTDIAEVPMFNKIDISNIFNDHIATLVDNSTGERATGDIILFFVLPLIPALLMVLYKASLDTNIVSILVTCMSVFAALLFNLLLLIYDIIRKSTNGAGSLDQKLRFLKQIYSNISFCILIAILTLILSLSHFIIQELFPLRIIVVAFVYYLVTVFVLTLFMVLKRVHVLLSNEIG